MNVKLLFSRIGTAAHPVRSDHDAVEAMREACSKARLTRRPKRRLRYDWFLRKWEDADHVMAVTVGGPFHGQGVRIPREGLLFPPHLYTRHDFTHIIPYPQRYTAVLSAGSQLPPSWEVRDLAHRAKAIRWAGHEEQARISCIASGVRYGEAR